VEPAKVAVVKVEMPEWGVRSHATAKAVLAAVAEFDPDAAIEHRDVVSGFVAAVIAGTEMAAHVPQVEVGGVLSLSFGGIQVGAGRGEPITVAATHPERSASQSRAYPTGWVQVQKAPRRGPWKWQVITWGVNVYGADAPVEGERQSDQAEDAAVLA
jgi:hypothetical protein